MERGEAKCPTAGEAKDLHSISLPQISTTNVMEVGIGRGSEAYIYIYFFLIKT
jgi:hypothetical protein